MNMSYKTILTQRWPSKATRSKDRENSTHARKSSQSQGQGIRLASNSPKRHRLSGTCGRAHHVLWGRDVSHGCNVRAKAPEGGPPTALDGKELREFGAGYPFLEELLGDEIQWSKRGIKINDSGTETLLRRRVTSQDETNDGETRSARGSTLTPTTRRLKLNHIKSSVGAKGWEGAKVLITQYGKHVI